MNEIILCENKQWFKPLKVLLICLIIGAILSAAFLAFVTTPAILSDYIENLDINSRFEELYTKQFFHPIFGDYYNENYEQYKADNPGEDPQELYADFYNDFYDEYFDYYLEQFVYDHGNSYEFDNPDYDPDNGIYGRYEYAYYYVSPFESAFSWNDELIYTAFSPLGVLGIAGLVLFILVKYTRVYITNKRVYATRPFGRRIDLPIDTISAVSYSFLFGTISITSNTRTVRYSLIRNYKEMHRVICDLIMSRQGEYTAEPGYITPEPQDVVAENISADITSDVVALNVDTTAAEEVINAEETVNTTEVINAEETVNTTEVSNTEETVNTTEVSNTEEA